MHSSQLNKNPIKRFVSSKLIPQFQCDHILVLCKQIFLLWTFGYSCFSKCLQWHQPEKLSAQMSVSAVWLQVTDGFTACLLSVETHKCNLKDHLNIFRYYWAIYVETLYCLDMRGFKMDDHEYCPQPKLLCNTKQALDYSFYINLNILSRCRRYSSTSLPTCKWWMYRSCVKLSAFPGSLHARRWCRFLWWSLKKSIDRCKTRLRIRVRSSGSAHRDFHCTDGCSLMYC